MTSVSCVVITTLIVVSLANLLLLVHVIMNSMISNCDKRNNILKKPKLQKQENRLLSKNYKTTDNKFKFMAALVMLFSDEEVEFICGVAIIGKKWTLTAAHCVKPILSESQETIKITSDLQKVRYDVDSIFMHENYKNSIDYNIALIKIKENFKEKDASLAFLPRQSYKYLADSNATALTWTDSHILETRVKLLKHKFCEILYPEKITEAVFCVEKTNCLLDYGGLLVQKNLIVGIANFGVGCGLKPTIFTKLSEFENWFKIHQVEATFKK